MPKAVKAIIKLQIQAGQANPAPPVGPALGQHGVAIQEFCTRYNEATKDKMGSVLPVVITVYEDRSFDFVVKTPPAAELLKKAAGIQKGSGSPLKDKVGTISQAQLEKIAQTKMPDLNAKDLEGAKQIIAGTARQMGIVIKDK